MVSDTEFLIVGNWKMNGDALSLRELVPISNVAGAAPGVRVVICPPATLIASANDHLENLLIGGQDCDSRERGSYTGRVSARMLADAGASLVIIGHSECRANPAETNEVVRGKVEAALRAGLIAVLCVGESETVRHDGNADSFVAQQLHDCIPKQQGARLAIAYEPLWAIGSGRVASVAQIAAMHAAIRRFLVEQCTARIPILYGGSVTGENAADILATDNVDGLLVGGASLSASSFIPIIAAAARLAAVDPLPTFPANEGETRQSLRR